ncbi:MAG: beta strand repeat-containing protein, partial [Pyrinomonadaceae bacterium]
MRNLINRLSIRRSATLVALFLVAAYGVVSLPDNFLGANAGAATTAERPFFENATAGKSIDWQNTAKVKFDPANPSAPFAGGDTCGGATVIPSLPYNDMGTTIGATDDYDLPADTTAPTVTGCASCIATGGPTGRGTVYSGTGTGPDVAYSITFSSPAASNSINVTMDPTQDGVAVDDLALIVYTDTCSSSLADAIVVDDTGEGGVAESVTISNMPAGTYHIVVDGYSAGATPPGPSGPYSLTVTGTGTVINPAAPETVVSAAAGDLIIEDVTTASNDTMTISCSGANIIVTDPNNTLGASGGATQVTPNSVSVPIASVAGGTIITNSFAGNDSLTVDFAGCNFVPTGGLTFNGGNDDDALTVQGGSFDTGVSTPTSANNGTIEYGGGISGTATINYTGLEPVTDTTAAVNYTINGTAGVDTINIVNGPGGTTQVNSGLTPTFELINFANKTNVTVNGGSGDDLVTVNFTAAAAGLANLALNGNNNIDDVNILALPAALTVAVDLGTGVPNDRVVIGSTFAAFNTGVGSLNAILSPVTVDDAGGVGEIFIDDSGDATADNVTVTNISISGAGPASVNYIGANINTIQLALGGGNDVIVVNSTGVDDFSNGRLTVFGNGGGDSFTINGDTLSGRNTFDGGTGDDSFGVNVTTGLGSAAQAHSPFSNLRIDGGVSGTDPLTINGTSAADTASVGSGLAGDGTFTLNGSPNVEFTGITGFTYSAGNDADVATINMGTASTRLMTMNVNGGSGEDDLNVLALPAGITLNPDTQGGLPERVVLGGTLATFNNGTGSLANILGIVNINDSGGVGDIFVDNSSDANNRSFTLSSPAAGMLRLDPAFLPGHFNYVNDNIQDVQIASGGGDDTFTVTATSNNVGFGDPTTTIFGNDGVDTFDVTGSGIAPFSTLVLNGNDGNDIFNVSPVPNNATPSGFFVNGGAPTTFPGDVLNVDETGVTAPLLTLDVNGDGTFTSTSHQTINITSIEVNQPPVITPPGPQAFDEGASVTVDLGSFTDAGDAGPWDVVIDWGDGSPNTTFSQAAAGTIGTVGQRTHVYEDDNPSGTSSDDYTLTVTVTDTGMLSDSETSTVTVNNVAPSNVMLSLSATTIDENSSTTLSGSFTDPGTLDTHAVTINWGDGSPNTVLNLAAGVTAIPDTAHTYVDDNPPGTPSDVYTITVTVADDDLGVGRPTGAPAVKNAARAFTSVRSDGGLPLKGVRDTSADPMANVVIVE